MRAAANTGPNRLQTECGLWLLWGSWLGGLVGYIYRTIWWHIAGYVVFIEITGLTLMFFLKSNRKADQEAPENTGSPERQGPLVIAGAKAESRPDGNAETTIAAGTVVTGTCQIQGGLRVMGRFEGEILAPEGQVCIMPGGEVVGKIEAREVSIDGRVEGEVTTTTLSILSHGYMQGDITMSSLTIATGGVFCGVSHRTVPEPDIPTLQLAPVTTVVPEVM
ncbi:polymer-forming cytoskeletal protein [Escherichia coli]|nr:polymer-forming cytoskeletal protein [Escherichia coli]